MIVCSSCINNLKEYGTLIILKDRPYFVIFSRFKPFPSGVSINLIGPSNRGLKNRFFSGLYNAIKPVELQTAIAYLSALSIIDSLKNSEAPCEINPSRSISPIRKPPSFALPPTGCFVKAVLGPKAR